MLFEMVVSSEGRCVCGPLEREEGLMGKKQLTECRNTRCSGSNTPRTSVSAPVGSSRERFREPGHAEGCMEAQRRAHLSLFRRRVVPQLVGALDAVLGPRQHGCGLVSRGFTTVMGSFPPSQA